MSRRVSRTPDIFSRETRKTGPMTACRPNHIRQASYRRAHRGHSLSHPSPVSRVEATHPRVGLHPDAELEEFAAASAYGVGDLFDMPPVHASVEGRIVCGVSGHKPKALL